MSEIVFSPGSLGGVGYEIVMRECGADCTVYGDAAEWEKTASTLGLKPPRILQGAVRDLDVQAFCKENRLTAPESPAFAHLLAAMAYVAERPRERVLITGPMRKIDFPAASASVLGHTEVLRSYYRVNEVTMLFLSDETAMAPLTRHIPLKQVPTAVTPQLLTRTLGHIRDAHALFGKHSGEELRIAVTGINPHAGEGGKIGQEETQWMQKLLYGMRDDGWNITGPVSADSSLTPAMRPRFDVVVSCYHDQLLPAFKALYFGKSAQCTLGLPIVRVSVDHGTAEDLYLKGKADCGSLRTAVRWAKRNLDTRKAGQ